MSIESNKKMFDGIPSSFIGKPFAKLSSVKAGAAIGPGLFG